MIVTGSEAATAGSTEGDEGATRTGTAGWLPALTVTSAAGLLLVALADTAARRGNSWAEALFWTGLATLFVPVAARLLSAHASRRERLGLVTVLGMGFYLAKIMHSPLSFTFVDEFVHWRTADDIARSHHLFHANPLIPVSPFYPGLEIVTSAVMSVSHLPAFPAGVLVVGVARLVLSLALYLFYEQVGRSARVAGIAAVLYMTNPNFLYFDAQFSYESLALPLTIVVLFAVERRLNVRGSYWVGLNVVTILVIAAIVVTHHLTGFALVALLALRAVTAIPGRMAGDGRHGAGPGGVALLALVLTLAWLAYVATLTIGYLAPNFVSAVSQFVHILLGETQARQLFRSSTGQVEPLWQRITGLASVVLLLAGLPLGLVAFWRQHRASAAGLALAIGALAYPVSLGLRLTASGAEISNRASEFVFVALAFVVAVGVTDYGLSSKSRRMRAWQVLGMVVAATVVLFGGVIVGWPPWDRLPGPYLLLADSRSVEPQGVGAALWARAQLGPDNRVVADRTNVRLMATYGQQRIVTHLYDNVDASIAFIAPTMGPVQRAVLRNGQVRYLVVDRRLSSGLPPGGVYFENDGPFKHPISAAALAKFDNLKGVDRVFDSGDIVIYDVGRLSDGP